MEYKSGGGFENLQYQDDRGGAIYDQAIHDFCSSESNDSFAAYFSIWTIKALTQLFPYATQ